MFAPGVVPQPVQATGKSPVSKNGSHAYADATSPATIASVPVGSVP